MCFGDISTFRRNAILFIVSTEDCEHPRSMSSESEHSCSNNRSPSDRPPEQNVDILDNGSTDFDYS
jgi:hypothetical protein